MRDLRIVGAQEDRPDRQACSRSLFWNLSSLLMAVLTACFILQQIVIVHLEKPYDAYLALSGYGIKSGHLWELFTYQFLHRGLVHWLCNLAGLWLVGRAVQAGLGRQRFLLLFFGASFAGAVLQGSVALAGFLLPEALEPVAMFLRERFGGPVVGPSAGLCGLFAAFCWLKRETNIRLFYFFPIRASRLWWTVLGLATLLIIFPSDPDLAHLAHLGSLLAGLVLLKWITPRASS